MNKRGMETEVLVKIVIVFVVLSVVILFFSGGFRSTGGKLANATEDVTDPVSDVVSAIESGVSAIGGSGDCNVEDEQISATACKVHVSHPIGCPLTATGGGELYTVAKQFGPLDPPISDKLCNDKCKIEVTVCSEGASGTTFKYDLWEI